MNTELSTQPYRSFEETLNKLINIPVEIKKRLTDEFERRRLEIQNKPKGEACLITDQEEIGEESKA